MEGMACDDHERNIRDTKFFIKIMWSLFINTCSIFFVLVIVLIIFNK